MGDPNTDKAAIVAEVREKFDASDGALLTEYRGLDVLPGCTRKSFVRWW